MGGHRGRAEVPAGQGHRELDLAEGRRREVSPERRDRAQVWRGGGGDGLRRAGPGRDVRGQDPHLRARLPHPGGRGRFPARRHHLRSEHPHRRHRHGGAQQLRGRLHQRHALDQGQPAAREGQRRRLEHLVQFSRQQQGSRGHALRVSLSRHRGGHGHGHRECRDARGLRGDRARAEGAGGGRAAQSPSRRDRAPGGARRNAEGRERRRGGRTKRRPKNGATARSKSVFRTRWSRASTRTSRSTPRKPASNWAVLCW